MCIDLCYALAPEPMSVSKAQTKNIPDVPDVTILK